MTSEAKHTPGPWTAHWSKYREGTFIVQAGAPSNRVLAVFDGDGDGPDAEEIASAHLIAAATDMLAALRDAEPVINASISYYGTDAALAALRTVREAISKAEAAS